MASMTHSKSSSNETNKSKNKNNVITVNSFNIENFKISDMFIRKLPNGTSIKRAYFNFHPNGIETGKLFYLQTPEMKSPFGAGSYGEDVVKKWSIELSFSQESENKFLNNIKEIDNFCIENAFQNSKAWFNKANMKKDNIELLYNPLIRYNMKDGEQDSKYPPRMKFKIPNKEGTNMLDPSVKVFDYDTNEAIITENVSIEELFPKSCFVKCLIVSQGIYFAAGKFGLSFRVEHIKVKLPESIKGYSFKDSDDEEQTEPKEKTTTKKSDKKASESNNKKEKESENDEKSASDEEFVEDSDIDE
jgi:hypothetical protein